MRAPHGASADLESITMRYREAAMSSTRKLVLLASFTFAIAGPQRACRRQQQKPNIFQILADVVGNCAAKTIRF